MSRRIAIVLILAAALTAGAVSFVLARTILPAPPAGSPVPRVITYEGNLDQNGQPAPDGKYTMTFYFFDTKDGGNQLGGPYTSTVEAYAGRFAAEIGPVGEDNVFESANLWLEMWVAKGEDAGSGYQLSPRQKVNSSPLAVRAEKAEMSVSIGRTAPIVTLVSSGMSDPKAL